MEIQCPKQLRLIFSCIEDKKALLLTLTGRWPHLHALGKGLGVLQDLLLVGLELGLSSLLEGAGQAGDGVVVGSALSCKQFNNKHPSTKQNKT
eukprot:scaffold6943_cov39-Prasinocladus_malaysianus.AAC.1